MPFCGQCGAPVRENQQCSACGALDAALGLDIDESAARATPSPGSDGDRPNAAQIGAADLPAESPSPAQGQPPPEPALQSVRNARSFDEREHSNRLLFWRVSRIPVLLILGWFTASHLFFGSTWVFIDNVNLLIHEAGHVAFSWAGQTIYVLGGTLGQLMMPAAFVAYFLWWRGERFAGVVCVWWLAENLMPIATYMGDAPTEELPLLGGGKHDWAYLMAKWDLLHRAQDIAQGFRWFGQITMLGTLLLLLWWTLQPTGRELASPAD